MSDERGEGGAACRPGVIFDVDGTLADTLADITDALNIVLTDLGRPATTRSVVRPLLGTGLRFLVDQLFGVADENRISELVARYRPVYYRGMLNQTRLYDGVAAFLDWLADRGVPMSILSNKPHPFTVPICASLLDRWSFVHIEGVQSEERRKPNPIAALEIAKRMDRRCEDLVFVGDSGIDVETGRRAGMRTIGVTWGYRDREDLIGADAIIDDPAELPSTLGSWFACLR